MNFLYLNWHPKFTVATHKSSKVLLSSSSTNYILDIAQLPFIQFINGTFTAAEIEQKLESAYDKSSFHYYLDHMRSAGLVCDTTHIDNEATVPAVKILQPQKNAHFSAFFDTLDVQLIVLTKNIAQIDYAQIPQSSRFIIIEDFYDSYVISPVFSIDETSQIDAYIGARLNNLPLINFIDQHQEHIKLSYSVYNEASLNISTSLLHNLAYHYNCTVVTNEQILDSYTIPHAATSHLSEPKIELVDQPIANDKDGGSRVISAQSTVDKILPYVNRYTGLINQLSLLTENSSPIKIYRTAFYKQGCRSLATAKIDHFNQTCLGKGVEPIQSKASALCEALERRNAQFRSSDVGLYSTPQALKAKYYQFQNLTPYSELQYKRFNDRTHPDSKRHQAAKPYNGSEIYWQSCWSLARDEVVYIPSVLCYANTPYIEQEYGCWHSNGCATGNTLEEAILQATFELIERDATAMWWYNKINRPSFDLTRLDPQYFTPLDESLTATHHYWVLDITNDLGIPVMAAIARDRKTNGLIFGFGCHLNPELAAQRALTELCQLIPIRNQNSAPFDFDAITEESFLDIHRNEKEQSYMIESTYNLKLDILNIVEHLKSYGMDMVILDYKRIESPMHTAKVFVPGLCHIWPQLGNPRLYDTPVKLGWLAEPLTEQTINQQGLYI
ncbi:YcaO-like family protein [Pseudoalteromonas sp. T1lg23B]|uniref:YcaO-like family protein n=1 Tax=Pseudoalteromonas sp. T1lg23B TaxID=2077097 RepID=UPI000CF6CD45|nr:YcaO-like family protein [Pseudoalteromonas sp. T1lg23B]